MANPDFDVAIVGGGPVGAALAIALGGSGKTVAVLEARSQAGLSTDARTLAMSFGSRLILDRLGVWDRIGQPTPIETIHVSQRGGFGRTVLQAREAGIPALGYVVRYATLQRAFADALGAAPATFMSGAAVASVAAAEDSIAIDVQTGDAAKSLTARLVVIADGSGRLGEHAGAEIKTTDYGQHAIVGLVACSRAHEGRAYERFTPDGPVALLPFENRYALVWTAAPAVAERLVDLAQGPFLDTLQDHFGDRAGRFESIDSRARFPLALRYAADPVLPRMIMLGNAAQSLHPIAGQGFNLGLRDAWELGEVLAQESCCDAGSDATLERYRGIRRRDRAHGIALTHSLVKIFSNDVAPMRIARGIALSTLDMLPAARRAFTQNMIFGA